MGIYETNLRLDLYRVGKKLDLSQLLCFDRLPPWPETGAQMNNYDTHPDEQLEPQILRHSEPQSSSSSESPTSNENSPTKKRRRRTSRRRDKGDAVLLQYMAPDLPEVSQAAVGSRSQSDSDSESGDSDDPMDDETRQPFPALPDPVCDSRPIDKLSNGHFTSHTALFETDFRMIRIKEECNTSDQDHQHYRDRSTSTNSNQGSVKSESWIKIERRNTDLSVDDLPFIEGPREQRLKPLTNSGNPSRQTSGDMALSEKLPSIHEMISHVDTRIAHVNFHQCSTPTSFHDERSPSSCTTSRRNTFSSQSPLDIQPYQHRRRPTPQLRHPPPRLQSTSSGSTTTNTSGRSGSTCTSRTESITPRSLPTPSDGLVNASSPPEQSSPESSLYPVPLGGYTCNWPGCTASPFQTQYLLNSHKNVHSSERPHYCPVNGCKRAEGGKGFKRKNEMIRHGLVHSSPGYVCPYCPDRSHTYPRPDNLQRHVSLHHKERDKRDPSLRDVLAQRPPGMGASSSRRRRA